MMEAFITEPGFWAAIALLAVTASQALGAFWARADFEKLEWYASTLFGQNTSEFSPTELELARMMMRNATSWAARPVLFLAVPVFSIYMLGRIIFLAVAGRELTPESVLGRSAKPQGDWMNTINGAIWKSFPLLLVWLLAWFLVPMLLLVLLLGSPVVARRILERLSIAVLGHPRTN